MVRTIHGVDGRVLASFNYMQSVVGCCTYAGSQSEFLVLKTVNACVCYVDKKN